MSINTLIFDFGNVIGFFSHRKAAAQLAVFGQVPVEAIQAYLFDNPLEDDYESGRIDTQFVLNEVRQRFNLKASDGELALAFADMFTPNLAVCELIEQVRGRYRLMLLSNTNDLHYRHFSEQFADVLANFDDLILSYEVGVRKPHARIFEIALERAGAPAGECLFIDDMPANIAGARAVGIEGIVYRPDTDLRQRFSDFGIVL